MADRAEILEKLTEIIVDTRGVDEEECTEAATLFNDLGLESIDFLEISFRMEEDFGFPFPTDDLGGLMGSIGENSTTEDVKGALDAKGLTVLSAETGYVPKSTVKVESRDDARKILKLIETLEENEDVQNVYANYDMPSEWIDELQA